MLTILFRSLISIDTLQHLNFVDEVGAWVQAPTSTTKFKLFQCINANETLRE